MGVTQEQSVRYPSASSPQQSGYVEDSVIKNTTDATATVVASISVAEVQSVFVKAYFNGRKDDATAAIGREVSGTFRRASGGNVTLVGALQGAAQTDGVTPAATLVANTTTQTVDLQVTGIAAQNWSWEVKYDYLKV